MRIYDFTRFFVPTFHSILLIKLYEILENILKKLLFPFLMIVSSINHWFSNKNETEEKFSGRSIEASERKFPLRLLMELRYSGAAGITADRVADKSFNNAKIRRAWMYNCGIFVDEPISLSLSLPLLSPSSSFFSPYPFPSLSRLHCLQAMLERRRNTSIFHSGKMSADGNFLKMTRRSPESPSLPLFSFRGGWYCAESRPTIDSSLQTL